MSLFQKLNREGKTIAFVTHEPDIADLTQRTIALRDGHIIKDQNITQKSAQAALEAIPPSDTQ